MNKKSIFALCLAAAAVIFGGFLPKLSTLALDHIERGKPVYQNISPISLETAGNTGWKSLSLMEKLSLLRNGGQLVFVSPGIMRSTEEEIREAVLEELAVYQEAQLLPDVRDGLDCSLIPCLIFDAAGTDRCDLFWQVSLSLGQGAEGLGLNGLMDDESRRLLMIEYLDFRGSYRPDPDSGKLEQFGTLYFERLGLEPVQLENTGDYIAYLLSEANAAGQENYGVRVDLMIFRDALQMHIF